MSTVKANPTKNIISIVLTEKKEATKYVRSNSKMKATDIIVKYFFRITIPLNRELLFFYIYVRVMGKVSIFIISIRNYF